MAEHQRERTRTLPGAIFLGTLMVASVRILRPFIAATIWATMIVVATWPVLLWLQARLWNRRWAAVVVLAVAYTLFRAWIDDAMPAA